MINIDITRKAFGGTQILNNIKVSIDAGEAVAILGPSGVGKTTMLRILAGLDRDFEGSVSRPDEFSMVFQEPTLLPWRSALDNITIVTGVNAETAKALLEKVGLGGKQDLFPNQLSLGQQRRLALARAFCTGPKFLIMDEPFASLDDERAEAMVALTKELLNRTNATLLLVTHSQKEAEMLTDRIIRIDGQPATLI